MENKIILIGGGNHHNILGVIRSLGERNIIFELVTFGSSKKHYVSSSKYVTKHHILKDIKELSIFLLNRHNKSKLKDVIISCADIVTEELNFHYNELSPFYFLPGVNEQNKMSYLMDKTIMVSMASKRGIYAPTIWTLPKELQKVTFPCITKSYLSSHGGKADIVILKSKQDLDNFIDKNRDEIFAQQYILKKEEVQFIGCSLNSGQEIIIPGMTKILRSQPNTNTGFLEYGPINPFYNKIVEQSKIYIKDCGYSGLFSIEFIRGQNDNVYFLEINFRNDGNAYCVTKAGVNLPLIWVKHCLGQDYKSELNKVRPIIVMPEFQDFKLVLQHKISILSWFKDVKRTDCFLEWNSKDKKPFFKYLLNKIQ